MSPLEGLAYGFSTLLDAQTMLAVILGVSIGTAIGVLPGIGPVGTMAILLPITLNMTPTASLILLAGIYYGSQYGGSTTAILVNVPGEACSVVTCREGYEMAKKGRAGPALAIAAVGSWVAGTIGVVILMLFAPVLANFALRFGPPEYFSIALLGLVALSRISTVSVWYSLLVMAIGMAVATVGMDPLENVSRFHFGIPDLLLGVKLVPVIMGLFGIAEVLCVAERAGGLPQILKVKFREMFPSKIEWLRSLPAMLRGTVLGSFIGLIPGPASIISSFFSYRVERSVSKRKDEWGHGAIEGVAGPESANNAAGVSTFVPMLSLGIPFTATSAMLLAGLLLHGVEPGPRLITEHPEIFWGIIASMYIGNLALLIFNFPMVGVWVSLLRIPQSVLLGLILLLMFVGAYSLNNAVFDVIVLIVFGIVGYILKKVNFDVAPLVVAVVIGPLLERSLRTSLFMSQGDPLIFVQRPISATIIAAMILVLMVPPIWVAMRRRKRPQASVPDAAVNP